MKQQLHATQTQQLALTPQLRQSLHLLQLSALELEAEVAEAIETNPLLDWMDSPDVSVPTDKDVAPADATDAAPDAGGEVGETESLTDWAVDTVTTEDWGGSGSSDYDDDQAGDRHAMQDTLQDHLRWQLNLSHLDRRQEMIGLALIDAIDDDGYLRDSVDAIAQALRPEIDATPDELEAVLAKVQQLDPVGCGARSLGECLCAQLELLPADTPALATARQLCGDVLERLPRLGTEGAARLLGCPVAEALAGIELLRSLDPKPGARVSALAQDTYVIPDAVVWREQGVWRVALTGKSVPRIGIHDAYVRMIRGASREDAGYLRGHLQEARWLLRGIRARGETLLGVVRCLAREQSGFLEFGAQALRPLTLREVAGMLGLHESTVSRAIARKHVRTPRGTLPLRAFFASGIDTGTGEASSTAIQSMLRDLISAEDPRKPLSDAALTTRLNDAGIPVARRTVAKYRELLRIPASSDRIRIA